MSNLSLKSISSLNGNKVDLPSPTLLQLPEKILQFGTGVLLRGLCDFVVYDANKKGLFNGRIVVVKSTDAGDAKAFEQQDNLYTICIRGINNGNIIEENIVCAAISRVLSAKQQWQQVLEVAQSPQLQVIISNTTEAGLQLVEEPIDNVVPQSFPAKLLAVLFHRYKYFNGSDQGRIIVIPTELLSDNGLLLRSIVHRLATYNKLGNAFTHWLGENVTFCNSLVDRIVTKDPGDELVKTIQQEIGYEDRLLTMCEDYTLWAIEGNEDTKNILSFASAGNGAFVTPDISKFKFLKLHLLNGTHTLSASLAYLAGFDFVKEGMKDPLFSSYVQNLQLNIAAAIPFDINENEIKTFSAKVLDRFRNPFLQHKWLNITLQNTMKMRNRNVPVIVKYVKQFGKSPAFMATGFAGYLLFMKSVTKEGGKFYGERNNEPYLIDDEHAGYFHDVWLKAGSPSDVVATVLQNEKLWDVNLAELEPFKRAVTDKLTSMINNGVRNTISSI